MLKYRYHFVVAFLIVAIVSMSIGYAMVSDELVINGNATYTPPNVVYVTSVEYYSGGNVSQCEVFDYIETVVHSRVTLTNRKNDQVIYCIKVKNNTRCEYVFDGIKYSLDVSCYDNENIVVTTTDIAVGDTLQVGEEKTFYAVFSYKNNTVSSNKTLNSILNYSFVVKTETISSVAVTGAVERFEEILNTNADYDQLITAMENTSGGNRPDTPDGQSYIGNALGSSGADSEFVNALFTKELNGVQTNFLTLDFGEGEVNLTVLIKREDVDPDVSGEEITLYLTPNTPRGTYGYSIFGVTYTQNTARPWINDVYAVVFTLNNGEWVQLGEMYKGRARESVYSHSPPPQYTDKNDTFNTNTWETTERYYGLNTGRSISEVMARRPKN